MKRIKFSLLAALAIVATATPTTAINETILMALWLFLEKRYLRDMSSSYFMWNVRGGALMLLFAAFPARWY